MDFFPVFAQQSLRELELIGRSYADMVDAATWAVFQEGYGKPWGANCDHMACKSRGEFVIGQLINVNGGLDFTSNFIHLMQQQKGGYCMQ